MLTKQTNELREASAASSADLLVAQDAEAQQDVKITSLRYASSPAAEIVVA